MLVHVRRVGGASHVDMGKQLDDYSFDQVRYTRRGQPQGAVSEVVDQARGGVALYRQRVLNMRYSPYNEEKDPNAMIDWDEWAALVDRPEFQAVMDAAEDALDPEVQAIVNAVCN